MAVTFNTKTGGSCRSQYCPDKNGCPPNRCPDFTIRRHDTKPALKIQIEDCNGAFDLQGLVIEANMWAMAKLRDNLTEVADYFQLADNIGFEQIMVGDIIVMERVRLPERMLVVAFDETNKVVKVQRGYHGTTPSAWKKGTTMRIFRVMNAPAESELVFQDITDVDGTVTKDVLTESYLIYEWQPEDTCLPGCYWLEFKVLKMIDVASSDNVSYNEYGQTALLSVIPSFTDESLTARDFGCILGEGVEWVRRFPVSGEGFLIKIVDSFTPEL